MPEVLCSILEVCVVCVPVLRGLCVRCAQGSALYCICQWNCVEVVHFIPVCQVVCTKHISTAVSLDPGSSVVCTLHTDGFMSFDMN